MDIDSSSPESVLVDVGGKKLILVEPRMAQIKELARVLKPHGVTINLKSFMATGDGGVGWFDQFASLDLPTVAPDLIGVLLNRKDNRVAVGAKTTTAFLEWLDEEASIGDAIGVVKALLTLPILEPLGNFLRAPTQTSEPAAPEETNGSTEAPADGPTT